MGHGSDRHIRLQSSRLLLLKGRYRYGGQAGMSFRKMTLKKNGEFQASLESVISSSQLVVHCPLTVGKAT